MKKLLVIAFMIAGTATFAQVQNASGGNQMVANSPKMIEVQSQKMKTDLGLSDDQETQIKSWLAQQEQDRQAIKTEVKTLKVNGQPFTKEQRDDIKSKIDAQNAAADSQLKNILTPDQYTKWKSYMDARKAEFDKIAPKTMG